MRSWKDCTEGCVKRPGSFTMSTSARQSPSKWNTTVAPKMASSIVFTGINGHILLCTNTWKRQRDTFKDLNNFREGYKTKETISWKKIIEKKSASRVHFMTNSPVDTGPKQRVFFVFISAGKIMPVKVCEIEWTQSRTQAKYTFYTSFHLHWSGKHIVVCCRWERKSWYMQVCSRAKISTRAPTVNYFTIVYSRSCSGLCYCR